MSPRRFLVTGGAGFIGSALVRRLLADGHRVRVLDNGSRGSPRRLANVQADVEYLEGDVRGCVGYVYPVAPLFQTVIETARSAAFQDVRFVPVTKEQAAHLEVSISVLSPLIRIVPEHIEVGKHGLMISLGNRRGCSKPLGRVRWREV